MKMQCNDAGMLLIDYLDNQLQEPVRKSLEAHLANCENCSRELAEYKKIFQSIDSQAPEKPSLMLKENFNTMLQSEISILATTKIITPEPTKKPRVIALPGMLMKVAASLLLLVGGAFLGIMFTRNSSGSSTGAELAELKNEVRGMKQSMMLNLLANESASERIKAVSYADDMTNPGSEVINALIKTLNADQNVNVRLAALNSVAKFSGDPLVRDSLVNALNTQKEPIIQIILINMLTDSKEKKAIAPIKKIISDKATLAPVKDAAEKGLRQL